jgi:hypothetical protein
VINVHWRKSIYESEGKPEAEFIDPVRELKPALKWGYSGVKRGVVTQSLQEIRKTILKRKLAEECHWFSFDLKEWYLLILI